MVAIIMMLLAMLKSWSCANSSVCFHDDQRQLGANLARLAGREKWTISEEAGPVSRIEENAVRHVENVPSTQHSGGRAETSIAS